MNTDQSSKILSRSVVACVALLAAGSMAQAEVILFDLGNDMSYRGASVTNPDNNGLYWNSVWGGAYYPDVLNSTGGTSSVDFGFSSTGGEDSYNGPAGTSTDPNDSVYNAAALGDLGGAPAAVFDYYVNSTFQIQGLDTAKTYKITFFGSHKYNDDNTTRYTAYTDGSFSSPIASADLIVGVNDLHNESNTAMLSGLTPDTFGIIYIGFSGANGGLGYLNCFSIQDVPAPSALAPFGIAALGVRRRRR